MRGGVPSSAAMRTENRGCVADAFLLASIGRVVEPPLWSPVLCQVLCRRDLRGEGSKTLGGGRGDREVPSFKGHAIPVGNPYVGGTVEAGALEESVGVWASLKGPCFLFLGTETCCVGRFMGRRGTSVCRLLQSPGAGTHSRVVAETVEALATQGHCVSRQRNGMRRRYCRASRTRSASQSKRNQAGPRHRASHK